MTDVRQFLIFDAYGTLVELDGFYERLQAGFAEQGLTLPIEVVTAAAHREMKHYIRYSVEARDYESWMAIRRRCAQILADAVREQGYDVPLSPRSVLKVLGDSIVFRSFPETIEILEALKARGVPMGVVSNWDYQLGTILSEMGLARFFQFILASSQVGSEKPSPELFQAGWEYARRTGPDRALRDCYYIGDHFEKDVVASRCVGMTPVWLVRDQRDLASGDTHESDEPDVIRIASLRELLSLVS
jgi:putative hydrolase of the HAD superfamily